MILAGLVAAVLSGAILGENEDQFHPVLLLCYNRAWNGQPERRLLMDDLDTVRTALLAKPGTAATYPFDPVTLVAKVGGKMYALLATTATPLRLSLKVDPDYGEVLRASFPAIQPGYHLNKRHWVTLTLDGSLEPALIQELIDGSYRLVVQGLPRAVRAQLMLAAGAAAANEGSA